MHKHNKSTNQSINQSTTFNYNYTSFHDEVSNWGSEKVLLRRGDGVDGGEAVNLLEEIPPPPPPPPGVEVIITGVTSSMPSSKYTTSCIVS